MKKIKDSLKYIKIKDILTFFIFIFMVIPSLIFRLVNKIKKRNLWLVCEDGISARDNGYHFFKYVRTNYPSDYCYYVIDKKSNDYNKVKEYGNIIQYGSLKHWLFYLSAKYNISNQKYGSPNKVLFYVLHVMLGLFNNRVFLQHGITVSDSKWLYYKSTKFKYFICGAKDEYEFIKDKFGYPTKNVVYTGFARFDNLTDDLCKDKQILIMPTWRNWLGRETNNLGEKFDFKQTEYYQKWNSLLNNEEFNKFIKDNNLKVLFYPHINMQKFIKDFNVKSKNIQILTPKYDIQKALKESAIMITDYSSVFMDFAYMRKPILFYQFDYKEYREKQLQEGYYDYKNGFGPSFDDEKLIIDELIEIYQTGLEKKYVNRMNNFFEIRDQKNCERIYKILRGK